MITRFYSVKKTFKKVTHLIFDLDGLLLDTEGIYKNAIAEIAKRYGKEYTVEVQRKLVGTPMWESSRIAVTEMKLPMTVKEFRDEFKRLSDLHLPSADPLPGVERFIHHLHATKVPIAVATSSSNHGVELKTKKHKQLFSLFHHIVIGGSDPEVKKGKPHPDIFLVCASRFAEKPKPEKCLVFEDSVNGIKAAVRAGMQSVMIPDPNIPVVNPEATLVIKSMNDIKPELFGLPPFN